MDMSQWHALYYPLKPGIEEKVKELFRHSGRPAFEITDAEGHEIGRLLGTMAFVGPEMAVRVIEAEGPLLQVAAHMSRQEEVREFEQQIEEHLSVARDMKTPAGARQFFQHAGLQCVLARRHDEDL